MPEAMSRWWPFVLVILASQSFTWTVPGRSLRISRRAAGGKEGGFELIGKLVGAEVYDRIKEDCGEIVVAQWVCILRRNILSLNIKFLGLGCYLHREMQDVMPSTATLCFVGA